MSHQLASPWSFYSFIKQEGEETPENYGNLIKLLGRFHTVEDFWQISSHIVRPSKMPSNGAIHLFRGSTRAMREDPEHANGGSFLVRVHKSSADYYWERLTLALIGEQLPKDVVGAIISSRPKFFNITIWHLTSSDEALKMAVCAAFCKILKLPIGVRVDYTAHNSVLDSAESRKAVHYQLEEDGPKALILQNSQPAQDQQQKEIQPQGQKQPEVKEQGKQEARSENEN